jgi:hypothetical protein
MELSFLEQVCNVGALDAAKLGLIGRKDFC